MKYIKSLLFIFIPIMIIGIILTILYYFDIISSNLQSYIKIATILLGFFLGGDYLGKNSKKKGWLEGLKLSSVIIIVMIIINTLFIDKSFSLKPFIYYLIIIAATTLGAMFGIRNLDTTKKK